MVVFYLARAAGRSSYAKPTLQRAITPNMRAPAVGQSPTYQLCWRRCPDRL